MNQNRWLKYFNTFESLFWQQNEDYKINLKVNHLIQKILCEERLINSFKSNRKGKSGKRAQKQPPEVFYEKRAHRKIYWKHLRESLFLIKLQAEFCEILRTCF